MAMNVKFLKGVKKSLPTTRDSNTLYFVTDEGALYLGATLIGANFTSAIEAANAAIKAINDHGYVNSTEVGTAIGTALESYYTKTQIDNKIGTLKIGDTNYDSVVDYVVAKTTGIATDAVVAQKADKTKPTKSNAIAILDYDTGNLKDSGTTLTEVIQTAATNTMNQIGALNADKSSAAVEAGKGIQVTVKEAAGKLTEVSVSGNYDNKYDALGAAAAVLGNSNDAATANTVYGAKAAAAAAQSDATVAKTKIETFLGTITPDGSQDIIDTLAEINSYVGEHGEEFAALSERVTKVENGSTVVAKANADKDGNEFSATYAKTADISTALSNGQTAYGWGNHAEAGYVVESSSAFAQKVDKVAGATVGNIVVFSTASGSQKDSGKSLSDFATAAQGSTADSALQEVTIAGTKLTKANNTISATEISEAIKLTGGADSFDARLGEAKGMAEAAQSMATNNATNLSTNYKTWTDTQTAIQGATTNTVKDCVDAINTMNGQVGSTIGTVENIVSQLTWGSF